MVIRVSSAKYARIYARQFVDAEESEATQQQQLQKMESHSFRPTNHIYSMWNERTAVHTHNHAIMSMKMMMIRDGFTLERKGALCSWVNIIRFRLTSSITSETWSSALVYLKMYEHNNMIYVCLRGPRSFDHILVE